MAHPGEGLQRSCTVYIIITRAPARKSTHTHTCAARNAFRTCLGKRHFRDMQPPDPHRSHVVRVQLPTLNNPVAHGLIIDERCRNKGDAPYHTSREDDYPTTETTTTETTKAGSLLPGRQRQTRQLYAKSVMQTNANDVAVTHCFVASQRLQLANRMVAVAAENAEDDDYIRLHQRKERSRDSTLSIVPRTLAKFRGGGG
jgi:hypothetical protein